MTLENKSVDLDLGNIVDPRERIIAIIKLSVIMSKEAEVNAADAIMELLTATIVLARDNLIDPQGKTAVHALLSCLLADAALAADTWFPDRPDTGGTRH